MANQTCARECCYQTKKCLHPPDVVFRRECGRTKIGGSTCLDHPQYKAPLPEEPEPIVLEGTAERPPTSLEFKGTYENDLTVLCAVCMSNAFVRLGLDPLDISDWAKARFAELTAVNWMPPKADVKATLVRLGYLKEDT